MALAAAKEKALKLIEENAVGMFSWNLYALNWRHLLIVCCSLHANSRLFKVLLPLLQGQQGPFESEQGQVHCS